MITDALKELYSNSSSTVYYDTIYLSHSKFSSTWYFISNPTARSLQLTDASVHVFNPLSFELVLPTIGDAQQDMSVVIDNTNLVLVKELNKAAQDIEEPIILTHNVYIDGFDIPQSVDITLSLTDVRYTKNQLIATATSADTIGKGILAPLFDYRYKGLFT